MNLKSIILGAILLVCFSCSENEIDTNNFIDDPAIETLNGSWKVVSFEDFNRKTIETKNDANSWGLDIIVSFDDTLDPKQFGGQVTTNSVSGAFDYVDKRQFKLYNYFSTFVGQPEWADKFGEAMQGDNVNYKINSSQLRIYYANDTKSVTLTKE